MHDTGQPGLLRTRLLGTIGAITLACLLLNACDGLPGFDRGSNKFHARVMDDSTARRIGRDFHLIDHHGQPRQLADFRGKIVVLFFGYTHCPAVCPTTLATMADVMQQLGAEADQVQVLFITLDPARDTRELLAAYIPQFHADFLGLFGDAPTTAATAREFRVHYLQRAGSTADSYSIDHTTYSYIHDRQGRLRLLVNYGETAAHITADIRLLLAETKTPTKN